MAAAPLSPIQPPWLVIPLFSGLFYLFFFKPFPCSLAFTSLICCNYLAFGLLIFNFFFPLFIILFFFFGFGFWLWLFLTLVLVTQVTCFLLTHLYTFLHSSPPFNPYHLLLLLSYFDVGLVLQLPNASPGLLICFHHVASVETVFLSGDKAVSLFFNRHRSPGRQVLACFLSFTLHRRPLVHSVLPYLSYP